MTQKQNLETRYNQLISALAKYESEAGISEIEYALRIFESILMHIFDMIDRTEIVLLPITRIRELQNKEPKTASIAPDLNTNPFNRFTVVAIEVRCERLTTYAEYVNTTGRSIPEIEKLIPVINHIMLSVIKIIDYCEEIVFQIEAFQFIDYESPPLEELDARPDEVYLTLFRVERGVYLTDEPDSRLDKAYLSLFQVDDTVPQIEEFDARPDEVYLASLPVDNAMPLAEEHDSTIQGSVRYHFPYDPDLTLNSLGYYGDYRDFYPDDEAENTDYYDSNEEYNVEEGYMGHYMDDDGIWDTIDGLAPDGSEDPIDYFDEEVKKLHKLYRHCIALGVAHEDIGEIPKY